MYITDYRGCNSKLENSLDCSLITPVTKSRNHMYRNILLFFSLFLFCTAPVVAQKVDFEWQPSQSEGYAGAILGITYEAPAYIPGLQSGARSIAGPVDLDGDGQMEVVLSDYSGGGRVHVLESVGVDTWELIYSSPPLEPTSGTSNNARGVGAGDLDGDGMGEIFVMVGHGIADTNIVRSIIPGPRLAAMEATGDNEFGALPDLWDFDGEVPNRFRTEQINMADVDGDGIQELLWANNGNNTFDNWYVVTATGLGSGFATWTQEARWSSRTSEDFDPVNRGGGSPYEILPADLDGDGSYELVLQTWNNLNFSNIDVTGPDMYVSPSGDHAFAKLGPGDTVSLFGCTAVDMDMNGDDEVYCPDFNTRNLALINYEAGENVLEIRHTPDTTGADISMNNAVYPIVEESIGWGITSGDIDMDGIPELIGTGPGYPSSSWEAGTAPRWVTIVDFSGEGDVEDPANYSVRNIEFPVPSELMFTTVNRDSAGTMTTYLEGSGGAAHQFAYLGDVDGDGANEVAMTFQAVSDSVFVISEVFNPDDSTYTRTVTERGPNPHRVIMRVLSGDGISTRISHDRVIIPTDFVLHSNYPNPFNPSTTFSFTLPLDKRISVRIYDMTGRLIRTLINDEHYAEGTHSVDWNGLGDSGMAVASGQYIYTLEWGQFRHARRMVLVK